LRIFFLKYKLLKFIFFLYFNRSIPTGGYSTIVDKIDPKNQIANMNQNQLTLKIKKDFKGIYQKSS
jgi:hypothetical protein